MIKIADKIWIGDSRDAERLGAPDCTAVLNVAHDLSLKGGWPDVEYMQVGLIDGPGNRLPAYCAAVLALASLAAKHRVMVCCHTMSRSLAVVVMYHNACFNRGWEEWMQLLCERADWPLPEPATAHKEAFERIDWKQLNVMVSKS